MYVLKYLKIVRSCSQKINFLILLIFLNDRHEPSV